MKVYISYFYQVRNFTKYQVPVSTALSDPAWYHNHKDRNTKFINSNGVIVGLRMTELHMPEWLYRSISEKSHGCEECPRNLSSCSFMNEYKIYLKTLDFKFIYSQLEDVAATVKATMKLDMTPDVVLLVHEAPNCTCAERPVLKQWFKDNGFELTEWSHR